MSLPKVSVLMPIYNTESSVLKESIESILGQSFIDFEYLILNDSPDNKELDAVVRSYDDPRIIYKKASKNLGLEGATNKLLSLARGEYIAIFDHDDISIPSRLEKQVSYLDSNPEYGLVSAQFEVFGNEEWTSENPIENEDIKRRLAESSCVSHSCMMVRSSVLKEGNIKYEKKFFPASSYRIITRIAQSTKVHNLPDVLLRYRLDGNNTSVKNKNTRELKRSIIQEEYKENINSAKISNEYNLDEVNLISKLEDGRRYFKAKKGEDYFFVKTGPWSFKNEYLMSKRMYEKESSLFVKPILYNEGKGAENVLIMNWCEGKTLEDYLDSSNISENERSAFFDSLFSIHNALYEEGVVHRDIIPRNLIVSDGKLVLIDLNFAVDFEEYYRKEVYAEELALLGMLGESYAAGVYHWDDAHSIASIATGFMKIKDTDKNLGVLISYIGKRSISPTPESFRGELVDKYRSISRLQEEIAEKDQQLNDLNRAIEIATSEIRAVQSEVAAIKSSRSYALSRSMSSIVGRVRLLRSNKRA